MYLLNGTLEYYLNKYFTEGSAAIINDGKVIGCQQEEIRQEKRRFYHGTYYSNGNQHRR